MGTMGTYSDSMSATVDTPGKIIKTDAGALAISPTVHSRHVLIMKGPQSIIISVFKSQLLLAGLQFWNLFQPVIF